VAEICGAAGAEASGGRRRCAAVKFYSGMLPRVSRNTPPAAPAAEPRSPAGEAAARVSRSVSARGRICETGRRRGLGSARGDGGLVAVGICLGIGGGGRGDWRESERWADWVGDGGALVGGSWCGGAMDG
jgi:hypothetical protein